jgi:hypothetical protein
MAPHRVTIASFCTHSIATILMRGRLLPVRRMVRRTALIAAMLAFVGPLRADARPIGFQFSSMLDYGILAGTPIWGSLYWNDLGPGQLTAPIQSLTLNIGSRKYGLADGLFPAYVQSPYLDPTFGFANDWGPRFQLRPELLSGGLTNFSLFEGGNVFVVYSYLPGRPFQYLTQASGRLVTVPEPGSLLLGLSGLATALYARRRLATKRSLGGK